MNIHVYHAAICILWPLVMKQKLKRWRLCCFLHSELPAAAAWPEPARHPHQVHIHGQEGAQQTAQTEGEEERVEGISGS